MLVLFVVISSLLVAMYIMMQHYLMKRTMYQSADVVQRLIYDALQDSRNAANFRTHQLVLSIESVSKAIASVESVMKLYGTQQACELTELDLPNVLVRLNNQKLSIMKHASEIYPEIAPENPLNEKPSFIADFSHYSKNEPESDENPESDYDDE